MADATIPLTPTPLCPTRPRFYTIMSHMIAEHDTDLGREHNSPMRRSNAVDNAWERFWSRLYGHISRRWCGYDDNTRDDIVCPSYIVPS
jgi:hypothetical protein